MQLSRRVDSQSVSTVLSCIGGRAAQVHPTAMSFWREQRKYQQRLLKIYFVPLDLYVIYIQFESGALKNLSGHWPILKIIGG